MSTVIAILNWNNTTTAAASEIMSYMGSVSVEIVPQASTIKGRNRHKDYTMTFSPLISSGSSLA